MNRNDLNRHIKDIKDAGNELYGFYVTYKETDNITSQEWGRYVNFERVLGRVEASKNCVQGDLPIERLILYAKSEYYQQCFVFSKNPLWNCVDDDSWDSHVVTTVPYIAQDGTFGVVVPEWNEKK